MNKRNIRKVFSSSLIFLIKPFIIPILIFVILLVFVSTITDILYIDFNNKKQIDLKKELEYYDVSEEYEKEEMKSFFSSVWDFVEKIFGAGEMAEDTDWPVKRTIQNNKLFWKKRSSNSRSINISYRNTYCCT